MSDEPRFRRLRAIFKNAVIWGVTWGSLGTVVSSIYRLVDKIPFGNALLDGLGMGIRIGFMGAITGAAFAAFISLAYTGKRLSEINWVRFGLGAAVVSGIFVPGFMQTMNLLSAGPMVAWSLLVNDFVLSAAFGGITAAGTMRLAQHDEAKHPVTVQQLLDRMERDTLAAGEAAQFEASQRSRSAERR